MRCAPRASNGRNHLGLWCGRRPSRSTRSSGTSTAHCPASTPVREAAPPFLALPPPFDQKTHAFHPRCRSAQLAGWRGVAPPRARGLRAALRLLRLLPVDEPGDRDRCIAPQPSLKTPLLIRLFSPLFKERLCASTGGGPSARRALRRPGLRRPARPRRGRLLAPRPGNHPPNLPGRAAPRRPTPGGVVVDATQQHHHTPPPPTTTTTTPSLAAPSYSQTSWPCRPAPPDWLMGTPGLAARGGDRAGVLGAWAGGAAG